ncbi:hypothetical protein GJV85_09490 [Sulfurimonas aquatica]|uniref:General glycosylation pathway protein n=1 Tax=Sulfurimonas aquatica TaxID=2672570 RepID=A0A975B1D8_9BACT|nr:hypothetical protein [Sulfurimonas aquatica]QSZ42330.1 hypothetical protein GJV85_09490 [Sulfurimonas aquatica]
MQEFMQTYKDNVDDIENFLIETIKNTGNLHNHQKDNFITQFKAFPSLELVYICNKDDFTQNSPNIYRHEISMLQVGSDRKYLLSKIKLSDKSISVSAPYISSATGQTCITVAKEEAGQIFLLDFDLVILLQRLGLVNVHKQFNFISKSFYMITANVMMLLALFTVGYALFDFFHSIFIKEYISIESIFKPVIALTLGLAIFDLAKTILEQEVIFKSYSKNGKAEYKVLIKFSITIIIALLIESLMVVFKIAIADYHQMIHAFYLVGGVSTLIISLGLFIYFTKQSLINKHL